MIFQGENQAEYPNGRLLTIKGPTREKMEAAKAHIEEVYCTDNNEGNGYNGNGNYPPRHEMANDEPEEVEKEMTLPAELTTKLLKMKVKCRIEGNNLYFIL